VNSSWLTTPIALVTTFQPVLVIWILAISFFVALAGVAVVSKGRSWGQILALFAVAYFVCSIVGVVSATFIFDIHVVEFEAISTASSTN
jgi:hypothetical protein